MQGSIKYRCEGMYEGKACYLLVTYFAKPKNVLYLSTCYFRVYQLYTVNNWQRKTFLTDF